MRKSILLAIFAVTPLICDTLEAQRGGRGRAGRGNSRNAWRRPDEVKERFSVTFQDVRGPETDGEKVADLSTVELVRAATAAGRPTLLYLYDGAADEKIAKNFENQVFRADKAGDELNAKTRAFHLGRIDISANQALQARFGEKTPMFVAFTKEGEMGKPVSMVGFKVNLRSLGSALDKAGKGAVKPSLSTFAKRYADLVHELEGLLKEKRAAEKDLATAGNDKAKQKKAQKELDAVAKKEQKLLEKETTMLEKARLPERAEGGTKVGGGRFRSTRGNTGRG